MPRSGTTWLGKIFDSHPDTLYRHEPDSVTRIEGLPLLPESESVDLHRPAIESFVQALPEMRHPKVAASLPVFRKSYQSGLQYGVARATAVALKSAARVLEHVEVPVSIDYSRIPNLHLVWKSIELVGAMGVVLASIPFARGVLILRHPCGYVASVLRGEAKQQFEGDVAAAEDFGIYEMLLTSRAARTRGLTRESLEAADPVERLAWRWVLFNEKAASDLAGVAAATQVVYEELCADPFAQSKRLLAFAGLTWCAEVEAFIRQSISSESTGYYSLFKDPLKSANKWRQELTPAQIARVEGVMAQSQLARGYLERA
jgi:hypothetical protein